MSGITLDELTDIAIVDTGGDELAIAADGSIAVTDNGGSLTVDFTRLLDSTDSVAIGDGAGLLLDILTEDAVSTGAEEGVMILGVRQDASGSPVTTDGDYHGLIFNNDGELKVAADLTSDTADDAADADNPIKVGGRGVSGVLTALSATNDRYDLLGDLYRRTWINDSANIDIKSTAEVVGVVAAEIVAVPLAGRRFITIQNEGNVPVFVGPTGITTATGTKISKKSSATYQWGEDINIFMISGSAAQDVRVLESA